MGWVRGTFSEVSGKIVTSRDPAVCSATAAVAGDKIDITLDAQAVPDS